MKSFLLIVSAVLITGCLIFARSKSAALPPGAELIAQAWQKIGSDNNTSAVNPSPSDENSRHGDRTDCHCLVSEG